MQTKRARATLIFPVLALAISACGSTAEPTRGPSAAPTAPPTTTVLPTAPVTKPPTPTSVASQTFSPTNTPAGTPDSSPPASLELLWSFDCHSSCGAAAVAPDGTIWTTLSAEDKVAIVDEDGQLVETWGTAGSADGEFNFTGAENGGFGAIAFTPDGGFYMTDPGNSRIVQFDVDRNFVRAWGSFGAGNGKFAVPLDLGVDDDGNVYVIDDTARNVQKFGPDGTFIGVAATGIGPYVAVAPDGRVAGFNYDRVDLKIFDSSGELELTVPLADVIGFATGLRFGPNGHLFVLTSDNGGGNPTYMDLVELDETGAVTNTWPVGGEGLGIDPSGTRAYVTNPGLPGFEIRAYALPAD